MLASNSPGVERMQSRLGSTQSLRSWWTMSLRGVLAVGVGALGLSWPRIDLGLLALLFGVTALMDAGRSLLTAAGMRRRFQRWVALLEGLVGLVAGGLTFVWRSSEATEMLFLFAAWSISIGVLGVLAAVESRQGIPSQWRMPMGGVLSVTVGAFTASYPLAASVGIVHLIGAYVMFFGLLLAVLGLQLRARQTEPDRRPREQALRSENGREAPRGERPSYAASPLEMGRRRVAIPAEVRTRHIDG
jgi:uncharacterized membrane protein HdeD (DUF308 family)